MAAEIEKLESDEEARIENVAKLTARQLDNRYSGKPRFLRGVHPKDHGCVEAMWTVVEDLDPQYRVGLFKHPGEKLRAVIRFSNASTLVGDDMTLEPAPPTGAKMRTHGSRGMAIKLYHVGGDRLVPTDGENTQDLLMINQPVFAFANIEDYEVVSQLIADDENSAGQFFRRQGLQQPALGRMQKSQGIIARIKGFLQPPFQAPPLSPLDNRYFSAAPFAFGEGRVMKFSARPVNPMSGELGEAANDPDYLRNAMRKRMAEADGKDICFDFQVQVRPIESLKPDFSEIEDVCTLWREEDFPFVTVARITIPTPQDLGSAERQEFCETLFYTPWHGLEAHRPLGGINRLRKRVYETSAEKRGCPVSPQLPPLPKRASPQGGGGGRPPWPATQPPPSRGRRP